MLLHDVLLSESTQPTYRVNTAAAAISTNSGGSPNYRASSVFGRVNPSVHSAHKWTSESAKQTDTQPMNPVNQMREKINLVKSDKWCWW